MKKLFLLLLFVPLVSFGQSADDAEAYYYRGHAKGKLNDYDGSCADWKKAANLGSSDGAYRFKDRCH